MKYTKKIYESWGGIMAITILLILIIFAIFDTSGMKNRFYGKTGNNIEWEDIQEQQNVNPRNIDIKEGQKLLVF